ncbi:tail fiber assembly protein [Enterobacter sp. Cy-643]|uniref:tail fiber assembly protein n=1 Tax=Enterobacter sp. Cy-643 TaxID=2608346 RepID=UPI0014243D55|nr:tail fiber assembly protein [Enterobacter sp. Cy-643]NIF30571.1 tail fiber assembly protein [Enterobacter sp. Cy-643]
MKNYFYSKKENGFFIDAEYAPDDSVEISAERWSELLKGQEKGLFISGDKNGEPVLLEKPPLTHDNLIHMEEMNKNFYILKANEFINNKQWPGKAVIGRLKDDERMQYNLWLDYLDALEAVDTSSAPNIEWPTAPNQ